MGSDTLLKLPSLF